MRRPVNASTHPPGRGRTLPRRRAAQAAALALLLGLAVLPGLAGCGYQLDSPRLPDNAGTLSLGTIRNRTSTGELDIRLQQLLRYRLLRHPTFDLAAIDRADMSLEISLNDLRITRSRDLTSTNVSAIAYDLSGLVSLLDRRRRAYYIYRVPVSANARLDFDAAVPETPAIRDEGLTNVLNAFAESVEALVLRNF